MGQLICAISLLEDQIELGTCWLCMSWVNISIIVEQVKKNRLDKK